MLNNKFTRILLAIVLVLSLITGGALAYMFKVTEEKQNEFISPVLKCDVVEVFDGTEKSSIKVKNSETSNVDAYLRVSLITYWVKVLEDNSTEITGRPVPELIVPYDSTNWIKDSDENIFYYKNPVSPNQLTTELLTSSINLQRVVADDGTIYLQTIEVFAEAIQAKGTTDSGDIPAVTEAWGVTLN